MYGINVTAEYIFMHLLNDAFGYNFINANDIKRDFPAIDLIDTTNEIVMQVTSSTSADKVRKSTIEKFQELVKEDAYRKYADYKVMMFYIKDKPTFPPKIIQEFTDKGLPPSHFLGIEDINKKVIADPNAAEKVYARLKQIFDDKINTANIPPQLSKNAGQKEIIGREKELQEIEERLVNTNSLLLINGIGGIGKTTIAKHYLYKHKNTVDYYGYFEGLDGFVNELIATFGLEKDAKLLHVLVELRKLAGKKLLLIDDIKEVEDNKGRIESIVGLESSDYQILFTSREEMKGIIHGVDDYYLDVLSMDDAKALFRSIYNDNIEDVGLSLFFCGDDSKSSKQKDSNATKTKKAV